MSDIQRWEVSFNQMEASTQARAPRKSREVSA